ncbi:hypothetical protein DCAR_0936083 [Daucus carota subsp. sativus]|uniref:Uncharacterized protein n=1 Tax=Daucus carota subsp. sativus TaxID=79200 RepID=A0AAF0XY96_DAUCS|nr:hypothetical protein DCAR_0936083 [Daucus carota subsp. sativus]
MTDKLRGFIERNFPRPTYLRYSLGREALEKAQVNLARLYINKNRAGLNTQTPSVLSLSQEQDGVVPHKFEGIFTVKGKENMFCTKNIVPGEAIYGETLIHHQVIWTHGTRGVCFNRVWDPLKSKFGAAIMGGVSNIWIKPGARVLYVGNVCGLTVSNLSDLVGSDGLVYLVGFCDGDDVASMAGKRPNVVKITVKITVKFPYSHWHYRMLVGMVDVIFAEIDHCPDHPLGQEVLYCPIICLIISHSCIYLGVFKMRKVLLI